MDFFLPDGTKFVIPDEWWIASAMTGFSPDSDCYTAIPDSRFPNCPIVFAQVAEIEPLRRSVQLDFGGFRQGKMIDVLRAFVGRTGLPPVQVKTDERGDFPYRLYDGYHRFYASAAAGFRTLPVIVGDWGFDPDQT